MSTVTASAFDFGDVRNPFLLWDTMMREGESFSNSEETLIERSSLVGSADLTSQIEEALDDVQSLKVEIPKPAEVRSYLRDHSDITGLLSPVCSITREKFGMGTRLSLEVYRDPEIDDEDLTLYVRQKHYDEQIMRMIEDIWATYDDELAERSGWLHVTTDFRPPE